MHLPNFGFEFATRQRNLNHLPRAVGIAHGADGQFGERLRNVVGLLFALGIEPLLEVAVAIEQAYPHHVHIFVAGRFEVVAGQDTQAARIDFKTFVQAKLHGEVGHLGGCFLRGGRHIGVKVATNFVHAFAKVFIVHQGFDTLGGEAAEQSHRAVSALFPTFRVHTLEQSRRFRLPRPPQVLRQTFQRLQFGGQSPFDDDAAPMRMNGPHRREFMQREGHFFVEQRGIFVPLVGRKVVGRGIFFGKVAPQGQTRHGKSLFAAELDVGRRLRTPTVELLGGATYHIGVVAVVALHYHHALLLVSYAVLHPKTETGHGGGEGGHRKGRTLQGRVAPRFVVGREHRSIETYKKIVVRKVE